jgi:hypothetical protein
MSRPPTGTRNTRHYRLKLACLLALCIQPLCIQPLRADSATSRDPEFDKYPFHQWLAQNHHAQLRWTVAVLPVDLSTHQRLILRVIARIDGRDLQKHRENGSLTGLIEYTDASGHAWQNHVDVEPAAFQSVTEHQYIDISFYAFVLPGDYTIALAVCDPTTLEHSITLRKTHVPSPKTDPLPSLWSGLPSVDPLPGGLEPPDIWYLPGVESAVNLPLATRRRLHIQLLVNATPTGRAEASASTMRENMSLLIPALKLLTQLHLSNGTIDAALLDLTRRQVPFEQKNIKTLDWESLRKFFLDTKPGIIDIHTLADRGRMLAFFHDEVKRRLQPASDGAVQVVIVLSGPAFFDDQDTVDITPEPSDPSRRLICIRYRTIPFVRRLPPPTIARGPFGQPLRVPAPPGDPDVFVPAMREDDLEKTAAALDARIFDAGNAAQLRRILATVIEQLARL